MRDDHMGEPMSQEEYVQHAGLRCPSCRSARVESGQFDVDGPTGKTEDHCNDCGASWVSYYELHRYERSE